MTTQEHPAALPEALGDPSFFSHVRDFLLEHLQFPSCAYILQTDPSNLPVSI